jgi:hypothetical protein
LNSDGKDVTSKVELDVVALTLLEIITLADAFTINVESVDVVGCDEDVGRNRYLSKWSGEVLTEISNH